MMQIAQVIGNIKTDLEAFTWTSPSGGGTSGFEMVKSSPDYSNTEGSPFVVITDISADPNTSFNKYVELETVIEIQICTVWALPDEDSIPAKQEEAMLRLREAWDAVKAHIVKDSTMDTYLGAMRGWTRGFSFVNADIPELNLYRRIARMSIKEVVARY